MRELFPMRVLDRWYLLLLLIVSSLSFLPWRREVEVAGMALFGWLIAGLMILSPAVALFIIRNDLLSEILSVRQKALSFIQVGSPWAVGPPVIGSPVKEHRRLLVVR